MKNEGYLITSDSVQIVYNGRSRTLPKSSPQAKTVLDALRRKDVKAAFEAADVAKQMTRTTEAGALRMIGNEVQIKTESMSDWERLPAALESRIIDIQKQGLPLDSLIAFAARLWQNPSANSRGQLYKFLEHQGFAITEKGTFLAYKGVREDYMDVYSGRFLNKPGTLLKMERRNVDDNPNNGCSRGFHVGTFEYASGWGPKVVLVEVDPADVVSVPQDCSFQKCRTSKYLVLEDCSGRLAAAVVDPKSPYAAKAVNDDDLVDVLDEDCVVTVTSILR